MIYLSSQHKSPLVTTDASCQVFIIWYFEHIIYLPNYQIHNNRIHVVHNFSSISSFSMGQAPSIPAIHTWEVSKHRNKLDWNPICVCKHCEISSETPSACASGEFLLKHFAQIAGHYMIFSISKVIHTCKTFWDGECFRTFYVQCVSSVQEQRCP